jgi:undecaprenyl diphosphate synthase
MNELSHIGIIMDGNRRWAKANGLLSYQGHDKGADVFVDTCDFCIQKGIGYLTVYAFSSENWTRPQLEISHIFGLLEKFFTAKIGLCLEKDIRIRVIGDRSRFDKKTLSVIENSETQTASCKTLYVQIALGYGGRDEITRAAKKIAEDVLLSKIKPKDITEDVFSSYLDTAGIPDVELVVRTGGEKTSG